MAHTQISSRERAYLETCIGPQLQRSKNVGIHIDGVPYNMNYCMVQNENPAHANDVIVLITGFGSGWPGMVLLGSEIAKFGYPVAMVSLLGYGNSDNPPSVDRFDFLGEAATLYVWTDLVLRGKNLHLVGHSMGASVAIELAKMRFEQVKSVTLLDPVGFQKRGRLELGLKFATNGFGHAMKFAGNPKWEILKKFLPHEKSPFAKDRLRQRLSEWKRLCNGNALESLRKVLKEKPVRCLFGERDSLFTRQIDCSGLSYAMLPSLWHNTTMYGSDETAKNIDWFVSDLIL